MGKRTKNRAIGGSIDVVDHDIVITDPCYLVKPKAWKEFCGSLEGGTLTPVLRNLSGIRMLVADTLFGDWACRLYRLEGGKKKEPIGTFTADAGMVCAAVLDGRKVPKNTPKMCYTVIPNFTGRVIVVHSNGVCHVEGTGYSDGKDIEFTSIQYL